MRDSHMVGFRGKLIIPRSLPTMTDERLTVRQCADIATEYFRAKNILKPDETFTPSGIYQAIRRKKLSADKPQRELWVWRSKLMEWLESDDAHNVGRKPGST